jgi:hypothetical protein
VLCLPLPLSTSVCMRVYVCGKKESTFSCHPTNSFFFGVFLRVSFVLSLFFVCVCVVWHSPDGPSTSRKVVLIV